jgi:hypothetical protein
MSNARSHFYQAKDQNVVTLIAGKAGFASDINSGKCSLDRSKGGLEEPFYLYPVSQEHVPE